MSKRSGMDSFQARRQALFAQMVPGSAAIIFGAEILYRNADTEFLFRQHSDMLYLTGFNEPDCCLVLSKNKSDECCATIFLQDRDPIAESWAGKRLGVAAAPAVLGVDQAYSITDIDNHIVNLCSAKQTLYYCFARKMRDDIKILKIIERARFGMRRGAQPPEIIKDLSLLLHEQRLIKSESEINTMRKAATISAAAHKQVMRVCKPGMYEYQLEAEFVYHCMLHGCRSLAYPAIVATGSNACILHYRDSKDQLESGQMLLIDAGGEYQGYAADITRSFPVNGKYTAAQKDIYELVLQAQLKGIDTLRIGNSSGRVQVEIIKVLVQGLVDLKLLSGSIDSLIENKDYLRFYMHGSGHWIGLDVHDAGIYRFDGVWRDLANGMVMTVEPGLYIPDAEDIPKHWRGLGVRIEDDVLVTNNGPDVLSKDVPKTVAEIEALMAV